MILCSVTEWISAKAVVVNFVHQGVPRDAFAEVSQFRSEPYACRTARGDALFELCDALLCTDGPVRTLVDLVLAPEHRCGHGALYGGLNQGRIDVARLRRALAGVPLPRAADGRLVLVVDVSPWLRPDANTCAGRALPHLRPGWGQASDGARLAVLGGGRVGDRPHILDCGAGRGPPEARRRRRRGDHVADPQACRAAGHRRPVAAG